MAMYQVIASQAEGYALASQRLALDDASKFTAEDSTEAEDLAAVTRSYAEYSALRDIALQMLSAVHTIFNNNQLQSLKEGALM